jgi:hypothetical protein
VFLLFELFTQEVIHPHIKHILLRLYFAYDILGIPIDVERIHHMSIREHMQQKLALSYTILGRWLLSTFFFVVSSQKFLYTKKCYNP